MIDVTITIGHSHIRRIDRVSPRRVRKMAATAVRKACVEMRSRGLRPLSAVDDLTVHSIGNWIDDFAHGLTAAAKREGISVIGGEMAQMPDTYALGYVGVIVYVVGVKP